MPKKCSREGGVRGVPKKAVGSRVNKGPKIDNPISEKTK